MGQIFYIKNVKNFFRIGIGFLLAASAILFAEETAVSIPKEKSSKPKVIDGGIPIPRERTYQQEGFGVGLGGGMLFPSGSHCNRLALWQGTVEYYYASYLSAGFSARMYGGNVDDKYAMIYQRYHTHLLMHYLVQPRWMLYVGPTFGFETTDLNEIRHGEHNGSLVNEKDEEKAVGCKNEYSLDGVSGGLTMGTGYRISDDWAVNGGAGIEYNSAEVGQLSIAFGAGFNLRNYVGILQRNFLGGWIVVEGLAHRYISEDTGAWGLSIFLAMVFNI